MDPHRITPYRCEWRLNFVTNWYVLGTRDTFADAWQFIMAEVKRVGGQGRVVRQNVTAVSTELPDA